MKATLVLFFGSCLLQLAFPKLATANAPALDTPIAKLIHITAQFVEQFGSGSSVDKRGAIPCEVLGVKYYQSGPAWVVGADNDGNAVHRKELKRGIANSATYKAATFSDISVQHYKDGEKRYFLPAYFLNLDERQAGGAEAVTAAINQHPNGQFVGFISFRAKKVSEPFNLQKHRQVFTSPDNKRRNGYDKVQMTHTTKAIQTGASANQHFLDGQFENRPYVTYEICFDPQPILPEEYLPEDIYRDFRTGVNTGPRIQYGENDVPMASMYRIFLTQYLDRTIQFLNGIEMATELSLTLLGYVNPIAGTILSVKDAYTCNEAGDSYCLAQLALDHTGGIGGLLKYTKSSVKGGQFLKSVNKISDEIVDNSVLYSAIAANATLATLRYRDKDWKGALGNLLGASFEATPLLFGEGKLIAGYFGVVEPKCLSANEPVDVKKLETNSSAFTTGSNSETVVVRTSAPTCAEEHHCAELDLVSPKRTGNVPAARFHITPSESYRFYRGLTGEQIAEGVRQRFPNLPEIPSSTMRESDYHSLIADPNMGVKSIWFRVDEGAQKGFYVYRFHTPAKGSAPGTGPTLQIEKAATRADYDRGNFMKLVNAAPSNTIEVNGANVRLLDDQHFQVDATNSYLWVKQERVQGMASRPNDPVNNQVLQLVNIEAELSDVYSGPNE